MISQFSASVKKEFALFSRTYRLLAIVLVMLGLAIMDPGTIVFMKGFAVVYDEMLEQLPEDLELNGTIDMTAFIDAAYGENPNVSAGMTLFAADVPSTGLLVAIILLVAVAGSEQKKRATIIPACSGLKLRNYLLPKFIIYPLFTFVITILATFFAYGVSIVLFNEVDVTVQSVLLCGAFNGLFFAFAVTAHLFAGLSTSRPGVSAVVIIVTTALGDTFLSFMGLADKYNPGALRHFALLILQPDAEIKTLNLAITLGMTFSFMLIMYFLTLFILNAKRVDNSGNDILL